MAWPCPCLASARGEWARCSEAGAATRCCGAWSTKGRGAHRPELERARTGAAWGQNGHGSVRCAPWRLRRGEKGDDSGRRARAWWPVGGEARGHALRAGTRVRRELDGGWAAGARAGRDWRRRPEGQGRGVLATGGASKAASGKSRRRGGRRPRTGWQRGRARRGRRRASDAAERAGGGGKRGVEPLAPPCGWRWGSWDVCVRVGSCVWGDWA